MSVCSYIYLSLYLPYEEGALRKIVSSPRFETCQFTIQEPEIVELEKGDRDKGDFATKAESRLACSCDFGFRCAS